MKKLILVLATIMMVGLITGTFFYQNQNQNSLLQLNQKTNMLEKSKSAYQVEKLQPKTLEPVHNNMISYTLQNNELNITYDNGNNWVKVPVEKDLLFNGEYNGNEQELINGSYILTEDRAAFLYKQDRIFLKYSLDHGKTWKESVVTEALPGIRFRKVGFLNDRFGYVVLSGDRTMSQELSTVFLTHDGGETWEETASPPTTRLIADGGFVDENTGFMSYGTINPQKPNLYVTQDGGKTWSKAVIHIPERYDKVFVQAEFPVKENNHLSVLVNQGPNGDYAGGKVKGKFISKDNGLTWDFSMEVQPNEKTEQG
ncbi:WD40/YVTN/BNR-like repeat-containing protein [Halobacillus naozhouensis]|uniref:Oxidoreductase n=1 Tax=Halobacillus naozhouensis TaxID=554880 RepID=A0ABY8J1W6_9BACI|nr:sialidase family protein [Halobacillus naozhouensis]WFT76057.1 oxidoreductase [Halobacillus naozhouensis]